KRRSRSPGLRRAGDGITGWSVAMSLGETTVEFRQAPTVEVEAGFEKTPQQLSRFRLFAKARETRADDGVIMRPDGAVMVAHRIVAGCMRREGTNAPAAKHIVAHQSGDHLSGFFLWDNAGPEALAGIRCHDITGLSGARLPSAASVQPLPACSSEWRDSSWPYTRRRRSPALHRGPGERRGSVHCHRRWHPRNLSIPGWSAPSPKLCGIR